MAFSSAHSEAEAAAKAREVAYRGVEILEELPFRAGMAKFTGATDSGEELKERNVWVVVFDDFPASSRAPRWAGTFGKARFTAIVDDESLNVVWSAVTFERLTNPQSN